jgi:outer membrane autotransporter protein
MRDSNLFAKVGGGWVRQWVNGPAGKSTLDGWGATVGVGYDYSLGRNWAVTPFLNYSFGKAEDQKHQAVTLGVGFSFY